MKTGLLKLKLKGFFSTKYVQKTETLKLKRQRSFQKIIYFSVDIKGC